MVDLFPRFTQHSRLLRLLTPLGSDKLLLECLRGKESVSDTFRIELTALSTDAHISLRSLLGEPAIVELLSASPSMKWRPFHGYITSVQCIGANGGFARYKLVIEPWCAFLKFGRDSRIFQDKTVFDILDAIFGSVLGKGKLAPTWRYDIADRSIYSQRSLTCQYQESNFAFAERLMHEEGLFYFFEHEAATDNDKLGSHTLVIADHNGAFKPNIQAEVRFTQPGAVMREDSIDRWRTVRRAVVSNAGMSSWDYRSRGNRPVSASTYESSNAQEMTCHDTPGAYAYETRAQGQRLVDNQLQALQLSKEIHHGAGTVRTFSAGTTFLLRGQAYLDRANGDEARTFVVTRVLHLANNNLGAELRSAVAQSLGSDAMLALDTEFHDGLASGSLNGDRPLYRNRIDAIRRQVPYRSSDVDGYGVRLHPRPTVVGQQTAIVVGPPGAVIHTDRDHRIKVQFHWQRSATNQDQSHSRLTHPSPDGQTGAPADDRSGTWVRIATPLAALAGANWGAVAVPRVGSEVLIDFLNGDIDRPVVIGSLYNGRGRSDAQENQASYGAGAATGNAPPWFPGERGSHAHPAVLSGIKTQNLSASQTGDGAYNQLVFDDSVSQARLALQSHAGRHAGTAELNLGALRHQVDNQRLAETGFGAELKTQYSVALRAGQGLLLSTLPSPGAAGIQLESREALAQIEQSFALQSALARTAQQHHAIGESDTVATGPEAPGLCALGAMDVSVKVLKHTGSGRSTPQRNEDGRVTAYSQPHIQISSPAGIVMGTPSNAVFAAGATTSITAGQDLNLVAQGDAPHAVKDGIGFFTYGKSDAKNKPNQETGIRLHAASGKLSSQSQSAATRITADKTITVASVGKSVSVIAAKHLLLTAQGACLKLEDGNIMLHAPGKVDFKATRKELAGPADGSISKTDLPKAKEIYNEAFVVLDEETKQPMAHVRYRLESANGVVVEGFTDALGRTQRIFTPQIEELTLHLPKDE